MENTFIADRTVSTNHAHRTGGIDVPAVYAIHPIPRAFAGSGSTASHIKTYPIHTCETGFDMREYDICL